MEAAAQSAERCIAMSKNEMIEAIRQRNRSAEPEFLLSFDEQTLASYLRRLTHLADHRGRDSGWVRESSSRAIVTRIPT